MQDNFTYSGTNINGHAPTTGTGTWTATYSGTANISTNGSQAVISLNSGTSGAGTAVASIPFTPGANTLYTLTATLQFINTTGTADCWAGMGFSDGNSGAGTAPWALVRPQSSSTSNGSTAFCSGGSTWPGSGSLTASLYANPIVATITWDTTAGVTKYYINNTLQWTGTSIVPSGRFYVFFEGFKTGNAVNLKNITLSAQATSYFGIAMQDNFTYTSSSLSGCTPTTVNGSGWSAKWAANLSSATIATNGTQALITTNGGTPGAGSAVANFPFYASPNTFFTLRAALSYTGTTSSDCWGAIGFSNSAGTNVAPWMFIRPQTTSISNPQVGYNINNSWIGSGWTCAASNYSAPIAATITWNTATGETKYYIDDLLQCTGTSTTLPNGQFNAFFEGFKTGAIVNMNTIALTSQPVPQLPEAWISPHIDTNSFSSIFESGTTPCGWPTARSHTQVWNLYAKDLNNNSVMTAAQRITFINYLQAHNIKMALCTNPLLLTSDTCTHREGFDSTANQTNSIAAIQTAIAGSNNPSWTPSYVSLDSPLGVCENPYYTCSLPTIQDGANQTATTIGYFKAAWPGVKVIQYDGFDAYPSADIANWFQYMKNDGQPIDGIIDDFNWYLEWPAELVGAAASCASAGVAFGNFWDGFAGVPGGNTNGNTPQFMLGQKINMQVYGASTCPAPARVEVASWGNPTPCGTMTPETSGTTMANLLDLALTSPYVLMTPPVGLYQVSGLSSYGMYASSYSQYVSWTGSGYTGLGVLGGIALNPTAGGIQGLVPIYLYYNSSINQYGISLSTADSDLNAYGYTKQSTLGYAFPTSTGAALGGVPLYAAHKVVGGVNQYAYRNSPYPYNNTFDPANGYWALVNNGNPVAYMLPNFFHNGYGSYGPY